MTRGAIVELDSCVSTQDEARARCGRLEPGGSISVLAQRQDAGRGREGRSWQQPPGSALLLSHARRGPLPVGVLEELPRRVADALLAAIDACAGASAGVQWRAPNDIVAASDGAKVGGILIDVRSEADIVQELCIGVGANLDGSAFTTSDGRHATSIEAACGVRIGPRELAERFLAELDLP